MRLKPFLILFIIILPSHVFGQKDSIIYKLPKNVSLMLEKEIIQQIQYIDTANKIFFLVWIHSAGDTVRCYLSTEDKSLTSRNKTIIYPFLKSTNRYAMVGNYFLPIIFDDDLLYTLGREFNNEGFGIQFVQTSGYAQEIIQTHIKTLHKK